MMAPANILNLLSENRAMHLPSLRKILSEVLCSFLTGISLEQYGHFQLVCGNEYPSISKMRLNFQSTKIRPTSIMERGRVCRLNIGAVTGKEWVCSTALDLIILVRFYFLLTLLIFLYSHGAILFLRFFNS
jgi:hypothetical protein